MKLSIIIPVYNEEKSVLQVIDKVRKLNIAGVTIETIIVNDGSSDNTSRNIKEYLKNTPSKTIHFFEHKKNSGKGTAVQTGIQHAKGDYIVIQDADSEYNPLDIKKLIAPIQQKQADIVYGTRLNRMPDFSSEEKEPLFILHYFGNRFLSLMTSILYGKWITDMETCYKVFPKSALSNMTIHGKGFEFEPEITAKLLKLKLSFKEIPIKTVPRGYSEGKKLNALKEGPIALWTLIKYRCTN